MFRKSLAQVEGDREETLRMLAALEKRREVPRHLLTKSNVARFASVARARLRNEYVLGYCALPGSKSATGKSRFAAPTPALRMAYWTPAAALPECPVFYRVGGRTRTRTLDPLIKSKPPLPTFRERRWRLPNQPISPEFTGRNRPDFSPRKDWQSSPT